jgi:hypothetical protein
MAIGMGFGMGMELNLENLLRLDNVANIIEEIRHSKRLNFDRQGIENYLDEVNGILENRTESSEEMRRNYVMASCIYLFGEPLLQMKISNKTKQKFNDLIWRKYEVEHPLKLSFREANYNEQTSSDEEYEELEIDKFVKIVHGVISKPVQGEIHTDFSATEKSKGKIVRELNLLSSGINSPKKYSRDNHFIFVGLYDVCLPILGADKERETFQNTDEMLKTKYGEFVFEIPEFDEENC